MKIKILLALLVLFAACKEEETPTPEQPVKQETKYYIQLIPSKAYGGALYPITHYWTDKRYEVRPGYQQYPPQKFEVAGFKDTIEIQIVAEPISWYAVNFFKGDTLLATDTVDKTNQKTKKLKWP